MKDYPKTKEEAEKYKYGAWVGRPEGAKYYPDCCAYEVWPMDGTVTSWQCMRKNGHGINGLYCKQHAKKVGGGE